MKVCCNMCGWHGDDDDLVKAVETEHLDGTITHEKYTGQYIERDSEIINACPICLTDEYITDVE